MLLRKFDEANAKDEAGRKVKILFIDSFGEKGVDMRESIYRYLKDEAHKKGSIDALAIVWPKKSSGVGYHCTDDWEEYFQSTTFRTLQAKINGKFSFDIEKVISSYGAMT